MEVEEDANQAYLAKMEIQANQAFEKHELKSSGDGRWTLAAKHDDGDWTSTGITEIVVGLNGSVIIHGDYDPVIFTSYDHKASALQLVQWVARSRGIGYLTSKAVRGMSAPADKDITKTFDHDVAIWEMRGHIQTALADIDTDDSEELQRIEPEIEAWREAISAVQSDHEPWECVRGRLYDDLEESGMSDVGEFVWDIGLVPSSRIFYGQAACRKLLQLLENKE